MPDWNNEGDNAPAPPAPVAIPTRPIIPKNRSARRDGHGYGLGYKTANPDPYPENPNQNPCLVAFDAILTGTHGFGSGKRLTRDPYPPDPNRKPVGLARTRKPFAEYRQASYAQPPTLIPPTITHHCTGACGQPVSATVQCLYTSHFQQVHITTCACVPVAVLLVRHGVFPASPSRPRTGVSIDLLEVYRALFERSSNAITALAAALHTVYGRRGLSAHLRTGVFPRTPGYALRIPFVRPSAMPSCGSAIFEIACRSSSRPPLLASENALRSSEPDPVPTAAPPAAYPADAYTHAADAYAVDGSTSAAYPADAYTHAADAYAVDPQQSSGVSTSTGHYVYTSAHLDTRARARAASIDAWARAPNITRTLSRLFQFDGVGSTNGTVRPQIDDVRTLIILVSGGDVMVGCDGNFSLRHLDSAGTGPISYDPSYFVSKEKVKNVAERITIARKKAPAKYKPPIPQEAFDACQESWDAANEKKQKTDVRHYDSSGVFVMTCRHSQQKYIVALLEELNSHLLPQATIVEGYDVACVTDHSFNLYPILTEGLRPRVSFIINAMHVFGHQWVCQMVYSPRLRRGIGLTDLEGVERFWSRIRKLIPITRNQWNSRRIWMIDKYASFINEEGLDGLGNWIHRQEMKNLAAKQAAAAKVLRECRVPEDELPESVGGAEGGTVVASSTYVPSSAITASSHKLQTPLRDWKRELDKVLGLQVQIDAVEKSIAEAKQSIMSGDASQETLALLRRLEATHTTLSTQAEALYASLNIQDNFPELQDLPLEFVRTLLMMRDLKINIRKVRRRLLLRVGNTGSSGTKLHQATRKAISKRQPALMRSIRKFNDYCELLARLRPENCTIPILSALSTQLNGLRNDPTLHEDIWISRSERPIPRWLSDGDVRDGIRSLHSADRCAEESIRLNLERENLEAWLTEEAEIVAHALNTMTGRDRILVWISHSRGLSRLRRMATSHRAYTGRPGAPAATAAAAALAVPAAAAAATAAAATAAAAATVAIVPSVPVDPVAPDVGISSLPHRILQLQLEDETYEDGAAFFEAHDDPATNMMVASEELDPGTISDAEEPLAVQDMLDHAEEEEETSGMDGEVHFEIKWQFTESANIDATLLEELQARNDSFGVEDDRLQRVVGNHSIKAEDLDTLQMRRGRLNNYCLNGAAAALHRLFSNPSAQTATHANRCAVLSTLDLVRIRYKASDDTVWKFLSPISYWDKPMWLIPIHRPTEEHWPEQVAPRLEGEPLMDHPYAGAHHSTGCYDTNHSDGGTSKSQQAPTPCYDGGGTVDGAAAKRMTFTSAASDAYLPAYPAGRCIAIQLVRLRCVGFVYNGRRNARLRTNLSQADMGHARQVLTGHILTLPLT
ncbi:hypothetical protein MSAN_01299300 [Mycena sanguinolenta]|uniref:CxC1-like cysteine cluster associated with KDZ transposases domain-containing protein n=1 Tax=Mycena sanguinolenta TaxID=230812 RepID=A0A8H6YDL8_9AGAR|nr:hypothetical protein MSAN_01299300 [Mycena sanguinolenta]